MRDLDYENRQVLSLLQAVIGGISQNMRVISLVPRGKAATLRFLLETDSAEDREEIEEALFEYTYLRDSNEEGEADTEIIIIGNRELEHDDLKGRSIYIRKHQEGI